MTQQITIDTDLKDIYSKVSPQSLSRGQFALANQMLANMNHFVPARSHDLRQTGHVSANGEYLIWRRVYGKAQYKGTNGIVTFRKYTTPGTGPKWDEVAKRRYGHTWPKAYLEGIGLS